MMFLKAVRIFGDKRKSFIIEPRTKYSKNYTVEHFTEGYPFIYDTGKNTGRERSIAIVSNYVQDLAFKYYIHEFELWEVMVKGNMYKLDGIYVPYSTMLNDITHTDNYSQILIHNLDSKPEEQIEHDSTGIDFVKYPIGLIHRVVKELRLLKLISTTTI